MAEQSDAPAVVSDDSTDTEYMLTTVDNPFNPFTDWEAWFSFDYAHGYHTPGFLARVVKLSDDLSEADQDQAIKDGIEEIVTENVLGIYRKVSRDFSFL